MRGPRASAEALTLLAAGDGEAKFLAGGQSLVADAHSGRAADTATIGRNARLILEDPAVFSGGDFQCRGAGDERRAERRGGKPLAPGAAQGGAPAVGGGRARRGRVQAHRGPRGGRRHPPPGRRGARRGHRRRAAALCLLRPPDRGPRRLRQVRRLGHPVPRRSRRGAGLQAAGGRGQALRGGTACAPRSGCICARGRRGRAR